MKYRPVFLGVPVFITTFAADMPRKKDGMKFEVHPSPVKDAEGKPYVYVRPASRQRISMKDIDDYCAEYYALRPGELTRAFEAFIHASAHWLSEGYRMETPIGTFAPKIGLRPGIRTTDPKAVRNRDVQFEGIEYKSGKAYEEKVRAWLTDGFRRVDNPDTQQLMADKEQLEKVLHDCLNEFHGFVTVGLFALRSGLTYYSARKQLDLWTKGDSPKLLKTRRGHEYIYTET